MKTSPNRKLVPAIAILLIGVGCGWLLTVLKIIPGVNWAWVLGLACVGLLTLILGGVDKVTAIAGPFLILAATGSLLRQLGWLSAEIEAPGLIIATGVLLLVTNFAKLPAPAWLLDDLPDRRQ